MTPDIANAARAILAQYNAYFARNIEMGQRFWGPHYVEYTRGYFFLRPFGDRPDYRYSFRCRPEFIPGEDEPFWIFNVL